MQNFRVNKAYRVSLYLLLLIPAFVGLVILSEGLRLGVGTAFFVISIPILFLASLLTRLLSQDPTKRWMDFIFILLATSLWFFSLTIGGGSACEHWDRTQKDDIISIPWTLASMFQSCSPHNISSEILDMAIVFLAISLILALWFLISDIKTKRTSISTI